MGITNKKEEGVGEISCRNLIDREELQRLQDCICAASGVCAYCTDASGEKQTAVSGAPKDIERMLPYLHAQLSEQILLRVAEGSLEECAVDDTEAANLKAAALSVRIKGTTAFNWVVLGAFTDGEAYARTGKRVEGVSRLLTEKEFYSVLDLFRESSLMLLQSKLSLAAAEAANLSSRYAEREMQDSMGRIEALTGIVQLLDSDDISAGIMKKVLETAGGCLQATCGYVCGLHAEDGTADILADWYRKGIAPPFNRRKKLAAEKVLFSEKPVVASADRAGRETAEKDDAAENGGIWKDFPVNAYMVFPLFKGDDGMCICFCHQEQGRSFAMQDAKFLADVAKILQNILAGRKQKRLRQN